MNRGGAVNHAIITKTPLNRNLFAIADTKKPKDKNKRTTVASFSDAPPFLSLDALNAHIQELGELLSDVTAYLSVSQDLEAEARSILRENYP